MDGAVDIAVARYGVDLRTAARSVLDTLWQPAGYTAPNTAVYPFQWLWDSCFHAVCWAELGRPDRALAELHSVFRWQSPGGFVPHIGYQADPNAHGSFWGRTGASTITQPPMYGHALVELERRNIAVPEELWVKARLGVEWLLLQRARDAGAIVICHPWESGCDDSPQWDAWCRGGWSRERWRAVKGELVASLVLDGDGNAVANPRFEVESPCFSALLAWNAELLGVPWHERMRVPVPARPRTVDDLLPALVLDRADLLDLAVDPLVFGAEFGPAGVRRDDPAFDPDTYWRGPAWPQLSYLVWLAARRHGRSAVTASVGASLLAGVERSGFAEHWHPDTGTAQGAVPQGWSALAAVVQSAG